MRFYSRADEAAFFNWLTGLPEVSQVTGIGRELHIQLHTSTLSEASLRELIALYQRYHGKMSELLQFKTEENLIWLANPQSIWYQAMFSENN